MDTMNEHDRDGHVLLKNDTVWDVHSSYFKNNIEN